MNGRSVPILVLALSASLIGLSGCGRDVETTGTNTLTVEVEDLVGAQGSQVRGDLTKNVDYLQQAPIWTVFDTAVTSSPFSTSSTLPGLPEGEFGLTVTAGPGGKSRPEDVKGQGCEMSFLLGKDDKVTVTIAGLNAFGDKGYGECKATITR
jgi:hypothetical protein